MRACFGWWKQKVNPEEIGPLKMMGCSLQVFSSWSGIVTDRAGGESGDEDPCGGLSWVVVSERTRWKAQLNHLFSLKSRAVAFPDDRLHDYLSPHLIWLHSWQRKALTMLITVMKMAVFSKCSLAGCWHMTQETSPCASFLEARQSCEILKERKKEINKNRWIEK